MRHAAIYLSLLVALFSLSRVSAVLILAAAVLLSATGHPAQAVTIDTVPVGNAGNAGEVQSQGTFGGVSYDYRIGTTEVTYAQYTEFLNAVAASDPYELYRSAMGIDGKGGITRSGSTGSYTYAVRAAAVGQGPGGSDYTYSDKPVVFVSWYDMLRFSNWLHNGQGGGDTEDGAYTLLGGTPTPSNGPVITRNPGAKWFLPSEDEWYKAAYHKNDGVTGNYWDYPTATDTVPNNNLPSADTGNSANFFGNDYTTGSFSYSMTDAGAYTLSDGPYGTFDQGGNAWEMTETLFVSQNPIARGGYWNFGSRNLLSSDRFSSSPTFHGDFVGFRVASIAEPSADFDNNGIVDGEDFLLWQRDPSVGSLADWEANYGAPLSTTSAVVPEPATCIVLLIGIMTMLFRRGKSYPAR